MCSPVRGVSLVTRFLFLYNALMIFAERQRCAEKKVKGRARGCTLGGGDKPAADRRPQKLGRRRRTPRALPPACPLFSLSLFLGRRAPPPAVCSRGPSCKSHSIAGVFKTPTLVYFPLTRVLSLPPWPPSPRYRAQSSALVAK
jgi:hypothetical protein